MSSQTVLPGGAAGSATDRAAGPATDDTAGPATDDTAGSATDRAAGPATDRPAGGRVSEAVARVGEAYAPGEDRPLGGYLVLLAVYGALSAALALAIRRSGRRLPAPRASDLALAAVATHKLARLLAKDAVLSPLRAPFTRYSGVSGEAELAEEVRGHGLRHAVGELLTCPFCLGQWVATAMWGGFVLAPRATRLVAAVFATLAGSDTLQLLYAKGEEWATS